MIKPKTRVPNLNLPLINDTTWDLKSQNSESFTLLLFYRGLHCPVCKNQLEELSANLDKFSKRGIHVVAVSCDDEERAKEAGNTWKIPDLPIAYNLTIDQANEWGLYISESISDKEPAHFAEPGLFIIRPDFTLYASAIQTMPFARPHWDDVLNGIDYITKNNYPARGGV